MDYQAFRYIHKYSLKDKRLYLADVVSGLRKRRLEECGLWNGEKGLAAIRAYSESIWFVLKT